MWLGKLTRFTLVNFFISLTPIAKKDIQCLLSIKHFSFIRLKFFFVNFKNKNIDGGVVEGNKIMMFFLNDSSRHLKKD
jgi:hypothetical protein